MLRLSILLGVLACFAGCESPGDRAQWEEAKKDLRGDNMQMRGGDFSALESMDGSSLRPGSSRN
jgi:hypothetical protein